jgi:hypothetical protein
MVGRLASIINLVWELTLLAFGGSMLMLGMRRGRLLKKSAAGAKEKQPRKRQDVLKGQ